MNDIVILNETTLDNVKETYKGDLLLFNHYPIKDLNQIINKD